MSARAVDLGTKLLMNAMAKAVAKRVSATEAKPLLTRYAAWLQAQREAVARARIIGRPKFAMTPERTIALDAWARTAPRPPISILAEQLRCSVGKAHALAKKWFADHAPAVAPEASDLRPCSRCASAAFGQLGEVEHEDGRKQYDVQCSDECGNATALFDKPEAAVEAWNDANPIPF